MNLATSEREKYEKIWAISDYRNYSPGEKVALSAMLELGAKTGDTVIDFGCGCGRPASLLTSHGFVVTGVDHTRTALDPGHPRGYQFVEACLWDLPKMTAKWGFCTDVMEHIPTEKVDDALSSIKDRCTNGVYFQIATFKDRFGSRIEETLHLTVKEPVWWAEKLMYHWENVSYTGGRNTTAVCR